MGIIEHGILGTPGRSEVQPHGTRTAQHDCSRVHGLAEDDLNVLVNGHIAGPVSRGGAFHVGIVGQGDAQWRGRIAKEHKGFNQLLRTALELGYRGGLAQSVYVVLEDGLVE